MPITGSMKAPKVARLGVMRLGASRLNYYQPVIKFTINGTTPGRLRVAGLSISDLLDGTPNTATMRVSGFVPVKGNEIKIGLGSLDTSHYIFAGHILSVQQIYEADNKANLAYDLSCISYEWLLNRRLISAKYTSQSVTAIVQAIMTGYTSGFTVTHVQAGLESLDEVTFTNTTVMEALDHLAERIGAHWLIDESRDLHFGTGALNDLAPFSITDSAPHGARNIAILTDLSQVKTRVLVEGGGSTATAPTVVGATVLPVDDPAWYAAGGGTVVSGPQRITYTGVVSGGAGSLVGTTVTPTNAPTIAKRAAAGLSSGDYRWEVTFVTASGETLPSPASATATLGGALAAPAAAPTIGKSLGGNLSAGVYKWKYSYLTAAGETLASAESSAITMDDIAAPATIGTAQFVPGWSTTGGPPKGTWRFKYTFSDGTYETLPSPASNAFDNTNGADGKVIVMDRANVEFAPAFFQQKFYASKNSGSYLQMTGASNGWFGDDSEYYNWNTTSDIRNATVVPSSSTALYRTGSVAVVASTDGAVTNIRVYRTAVNGSVFKKVADIANSTGAYTDTLADGSLGSTELGAATAFYLASDLNNIPIGPSGTTSRKVYRTVANGSTFKLQSTIANNSAITLTDTTADGSLGATAPVTDTSGLVTQTGEVAAGSTSILVTSTSPFQASGGWASIGALAVRYTGVSSTALTGIPASGDGSLGTTVRYGVEVIAASMLVGIPVSGPGSILYAIKSGDDVNILITRDNTAAQTAMAGFVGGDGIHEDYIQDRRLSALEAAARGDERLRIAKDPLVTVTYQTRDQNTRSGGSITFNLTSPAISGTFTIQSVTISNFDDSMQTFPLRTVEASSRRFKFEELLRAIRRPA